MSVNDSWGWYKAYNATLLVANLSRLARNAHFLIGLQESGVQFTACDNPQANHFTVGILALVAQQEAEVISHRTKAALAAAKARGTKLGGFRGRARYSRRRQQGQKRPYSQCQHQSSKP